jgi:uncharacterized glyoxalase superfamily protein PhnB
MKTSFIPSGFRTVTPYLLVPEVAPLMRFLKEAFGAIDDAPALRHSKMPDGSIGHAEMIIGDSVLMMGKSGEHFPAMPSMVHLYLEDVDKFYQQALQAGATTAMEPADQFYGERSAGVKDEFGNMWWISAVVEEISPEEHERREQAYYQQKA